ncbi:transcriptional regulator [Novosphingobium sp. FSY-8]|uniref:Transcriptional regulator n=1 Tax=Novosphingobium ovatum TaxID=1908523 RepID=A0ABW9XB33_9SPHN|nr:LexA family transcriptional regulator [Novosphingobium ovatum]NBC35741.1 transcriptional regulator [Novosphingobium ovatum]
MEQIDPRANLLKLSADKGVSLASLSALIGRNSTYLQQFVRKGSPRKLEEDDRRTLARFFGVAESELGGTGDSVQEISFEPAAAGRQRSVAPAKPPVPARRPMAEWFDVPRLELGASAGPGAFAVGEQAIGALRFAASWLRGQGFDPAMLTAIAVTGDSMEPTLRDGDEILVDRTPRPMRDGIHVVRVGDGLLVKRLDLAQPGRIGLISDNPAYRPLDLPREEVAIIGRVVWKGGRL